MTWPDDYINKVICGDCLEVMKGIPDGAVDLVVTDPPWNLDFFDDDNKDWSDYAEWLRGVKEELTRVSCGSVWIFQSTKAVPYVASMFEGWGMFASCKNFCQMTPKHIPNAFDVAFFSSHEGYKGNGRNWHIGNNAYIPNAMTGHPTTRPLDTIKYIVSLFSSQIILDPFAGSGTTLVAAKQLGRKYIGIEINPDYCKIAEDRLRQGELF